MGRVGLAKYFQLLRLFCIDSVQRGNKPLRAVGRHLLILCATLKADGRAMTVKFQVGEGIAACGLTVAPVQPKERECLPPLLV